VTGGLWVVALMGWAPVARGEEPPGDTIEIEADALKITPEKVTAEGHVQVRTMHHRLGARSVELDRESGRFVVEELAWTPCTCEKPPWGIKASRAAGTLGDFVVAKGAVVEVCSKPVLPLPWLRVPLDERAPRLLFPEVGIHSGHTRVGIPAKLPLGERSTLVVTPEVWSGRGFRPQVRAWGPLGTAAASVLAPDTGDGIRGEARVIASGDDGTDRWGFDGAWVSDSRYRRDFGEGYLQRQQTVVERLAVVGHGPIRVESNTFDDSPVQRPLGGVLSLPGQSLGPVAVSALMRLDGLEIDGTHVGRGTAETRAITGHKLGWLDLSGEAGTLVTQLKDTDPFTRASIAGRVAVAHWSDVGRTRVVSATGIGASRVATTGMFDDPLDWVKPTPEWGLGPVHETTVVGQSGVPFRMRIALPWTSWGLQPQASLNWHHKGFVAMAHGDSKLQAGRFGYRDEVLRVEMGSVHQDELWFGTGDVSGLITHGWRAGWGGLVDLLDHRLLRQGPTLAWDSACDCLGLSASVEWAEDRNAPTALLRVDLQPDHARDRGIR
jgi:hypothetical protein